MRRARAAALCVALALPGAAGVAVAADLAPTVADGSASSAADAPGGQGTQGEAGSTTQAMEAPADADAGPTAIDGPGQAEGATRNGLEIYDAFRTGLAQPECAQDDNSRWLRHFAHAPARLADPRSDALPLFGHVVDALRQAHLPTEFALIPFVESGYAPAARAKAGPTGLWQLVAVTARHHGLQVGEGYDGRLSPAASTRAAVRYLKTLNGMFGGNWRLAAMAYNAGENRLLQSLRRSGASAVDAQPENLPGLSPITQAYVAKLHALACVLQHAGDDQDWRRALDRPVPRLHAQRLEGSRRLDAWARRHSQDPALLERLNPALANGRWPRGQAPLALVPLAAHAAPTRPGDAPAHGAVDADGVEPPAAAEAGMAAQLRSHVVRRGESAWGIARLHGLRLDHLLELNGLGRHSVLRPGMVLHLE